MKYTFGTGTMRSGGALVLSILELDKRTTTFCEIYYFSRHIFKKNKNLNSKKTKYKISYNFHLILKYRNNINISFNKIFNTLKNEKIKNYGNLYIILANILIQNKKIKNFVEYSNGEWRFIDKFLNLNKKFKSFLIIRDPRSVIASFKKGRMNFRSEKAGVGRAIIHVPFGKVSFDTDALVENFRVLVKEIKSALPEKTNISSIFISPTMGGSFAIKDGGY